MHNAPSQCEARDPASIAPPEPWPFAPLTDQQRRQQAATEAALRESRLRVFRAFDDTVAGALA
jgi:hypothetical protein